MKQAIRQGSEPKYSSDYAAAKPPPLEAKNLVCYLLRRTPRSRCSASDALAHPFISSQPPQHSITEDLVASNCERAARLQTMWTIRSPEFNDHVDPTVQNDIHELLLKLLPSLKKSFSDGVSLEFGPTRTGSSQVSRRGSKASTYNGQMPISISPATLKSCKWDDDNVSTDASSGGDACPADAGETRSSEIIGKNALHL
jgi:serine/threonine protein kinase